MKVYLLFKGLFDESDPQIEDVDDVIGLCSGQFATQPQQSLSQSQSQTLSQSQSQLASQPSATDTPDTQILTRATEEKDDGTVTAAGVSILDSDDDDDIDGSRSKRRRRVAVLSDDSESEEEKEEVEQGGDSIEKIMARVLA